VKTIYYPIIVFTYNRPNLLINLLRSIKKNTDYNKHQFYFFCDGPKNNSNKSQQKKIRKNISIIKRLKIARKHLIIRKKNYGLANNVIQGVSQVLKKNDACIVLEDDLILHRDCIKFINYGLNKFKKDNSIGSISGYSYVDSSHFRKRQDWFKLYRHCSWSWGTWSSVWNKLNWNFDDSISAKVNYQNKQKKILKAGHDIPLLLRAHINKLIDSWAVRFNYNCLEKGLLSISPLNSLVKNEGFGVNATHTLNFLKKKEIYFNRFTNIEIKNLKKPLLDKELNMKIKLEHKFSVKLFLKIFVYKFFKIFF